MSFLGSIGNIAGGLIGGAVSLATGNVSGAIKSVASGFGIGGSRTTGSSFVSSPPIVTRPSYPSVPTIGTARPVAAGLGAGLPVPGVTGTLQRLVPGGASGYMQPYSGYHVNKRYKEFLIDQSMGKDVQDPTSRPQVVNTIVKNRKMNPLNPRALTRANARQEAAVRMMRRTLRGTGYRISRRSFGAKKRGRR